VTWTIPTDGILPIVPLSHGRGFEEFGILDATTGLVMTRVEGGVAPWAGQYCYDGNAYTFSREDAGHVILIATYAELMRSVLDHTRS